MAISFPPFLCKRRTVAIEAKNSGFSVNKPLDIVLEPYSEQFAKQFVSRLCTENNQRRTWDESL
ncbi:MAG: hypothetical protein JXA30_17440 [Deltaproteobacteria bacterium]|nr:hypothetical protein [Deltaproteobacteria bacterium]